MSESLAHSSESPRCSPSDHPTCCPSYDSSVSRAAEPHWFPAGTPGMPELAHNQKYITVSSRHTHTRLMAVCPRVSGWAGTRKVKPTWILLKQETVSGSGISWAICKSATHSRLAYGPADAIATHCLLLQGKGSPYSITECRVPEPILVLGSQPAGDVSHKPGGRLPLLSARLAVTPATLKRAATNFAAWWTQAQWVWTVGLRLLPDSVATAIWTRVLLRVSPEH